MDRATEAVGGASAIPITIDDESALSNENESWDTGHVELDELFQRAGIRTPSVYEPSSDGIGDVAVGTRDVSFDGYNFQNALRCADLSSGSSLPDLPWTGSPRLEMHI